ncbi:MAG: extracellular solute-binding protein [Actinophytocola sp.]|uniref:ABC transporter substrate-binding protein n=1 Tax=Actinophytocola sp. TaxID=1872138 RepID=UPI00132BF03B|nr:sugar ABC transporter substrate-binding protein [Actinophytocola sp.]MPZ82787.1 extracellular solute-binding protein [Actinophytocola sp.]
MAPPEAESRFNTRRVHRLAGRRRRHRTFTLLVGAIAVSLVAAACGGGGSDSGTENGKTVIRFANWADAEPNTQPGIRALIQKFEALHPDITVKSEPVSYSDIEHQLILQVQSGNAPDVAELQGNYTFTLAETGTLQPLDDLATDQFKQSIIPNELKLGEIDGKLVAIPWTVGPFALWYNKKLMKQAGLDPAKPPQTWQDMLTALQAIHAKSPKVIGLGIDSTNRTYGLDLNWPIMKSFGAEPFKGNQASVDTPEMKAYLNFMRDLTAKGYTQANQKGGFFRQPAASDQVAFTIDGPYVKGVVQSVNKSMTDDQFYETWGVAPLPSNTGQHFSAPTDHQLVMFGNSKNQKAAWEFMQFLSTSKDGLQYTIKSENSVLPVTNAPAELAKEVDNPIANAFRDDVIPTVIRPEWGAGYAKVYSDIMAGVQAAMTSKDPIGSITPQLQSTVQSGLG